MVYYDYIAIFIAISLRIYCDFHCDSAHLFYVHFSRSLFYYVCMEHSVNVNYEIVLCEQYKQINKLSWHLAVLECTQRLGDWMYEWMNIRDSIKSKQDADFKDKSKNVFLY